jgi:hypothetical protein
VYPDDPGPIAQGPVFGIFEKFGDMFKPENIEGLSEAQKAAAEETKTGPPAPNPSGGASRGSNAARDKIDQFKELNKAATDGRGPQIQEAGANSRSGQAAKYDANEAAKPASQPIRVPSPPTPSLFQRLKKWWTTSPPRYEPPIADDSPNDYPGNAADAN